MYEQQEQRHQPSRHALHSWPAPESTLQQSFSSSQEVALGPITGMFLRTFPSKETELLWVWWWLWMLSRFSPIWELWPKTDNITKDTLSKVGSTEHFHADRHYHHSGSVITAPTHKTWTGRIQTWVAPGEKHFHKAKRQSSLEHRRYSPRTSMSMWWQ